MDIFFQDPTEIPLPPEDVRIREMKAAPWPDGQRVHIYLEVDPFQRRPSIELVIRNVQGEEITNASIVESMTRQMELNMHMRQGHLGESYTLEAVLFYLVAPPEGQPPDPSQRTIVDRREISFEIAST